MDLGRKFKRRLRQQLKVGRIGLRLALSFMIIVLLTFLGSAVGLRQFIQVNEQVQRLNQVNAEAIALLRVNNSVLNLKSELQQTAETQDAAQFSANARQLQAEFEANIAKAIEVLDNSTTKSQEPRYNNQIEQLESINDLSSEVDLMIELAETGDWLAVRLRLEDEVQQISQITQNLVEEIEAIVTTERQAVMADTERTQQQARRTILTIGLLTLVVAAALGVLLTKSIVQPLARLNMGAKALARRDFDYRIEAPSRGELGNLTQAFSDAAAQLANLYRYLAALVEERTDELHRRVMQLETSLAVGHRIASILDLDELLNQVVELIKDRYKYSFVGVFLLDDNKEYVVIRAGTGEAGQSLRRQGFRLRVGQGGLVGWVAQHRRVMRADDVLEDEYYLPLSVVPDTRAEMALPLAMGGDLKGVLDIHSDQVQAFRLDDVPVLQSLADQVAVAIQNAFLYQRERSRRQLTEALYEAGRAISTTLELPIVLDLILEHLAEIVPFDRAVVMLLESGNRLEIVASKGFPTPATPSDSRILVKENDLFQEISQTQKPVALSDVLKRPDWQQVTGLPLARAWLGVPLIRFDWVIGMLSLTRELPEAYREEEISLAATFAGQAAIALENARLYEKIVRFTQQLEEMVRERTEAYQEAYERLQHLDRTKSDFINVAAHELRTPLTLLKGYSQMLLKDSRIKENSVHLELIEGIHSGSVRLHEIVNSMLDIAKIDSRALKLYPEPVAISSLIQLVIDELAEVVAERKQTITVAKDIEQLPAIEADPDALRKVFYHLLINAIKYTPDGGAITISGSHLSKDKDHLGSQGIEIVVSDTGIGIDPEFHELIFTKFYQTGELALHSSGKTKFKGSGPGLGLAIAQGIVEAHRGKLWVESPGYNEETYPGSRFHTQLPLRQGPPNSQPAATTANAESSVLLESGPEKL